MKTIIIKSILTLIITLFVLPMMSQDFMIIHFKDGTLKTFYFNTIVELSTSPYDGDGVKHVDIQYQHVKTNYDEFVYDINAMDSISFTKYNDIKEEENFTSTMTNVLPQLSDCETIDDVKNMLDNINESEGVEKAWIDGELLKIKVKDGLTISFNFDTSDIWDVPLDDSDSFVEKTMARAKQVPINSDSPFKVAIAHQQFNDLLGMYPRFRKKADKLKSDFEKEGIRCDFFQPQLDFFYDNVKDHNAKQLSIYDYDLVLLTTHGFYDEDTNIHGFLTGTELGRYPKLIGEEEAKDNKDEYEKVVKKFKTLLDDPNYKDAWGYIDLGFQPEIRGYINGNRKLPIYWWVGYVLVTESFFKNIAIGEFTNPNSILYNAACLTLMGGHRMANIFQTYRKLGTYLGYTESNWFGPEAGLTYFGNMLNGLSSEKSYEELANVKMDEWSDDRSSHVTGTMKDEYHREFTDKSSQTTYRDYTASLEFVSPKEDGHTPIFLFPPHTEQIEPKTANKEYNQTQTVTVKGVATIFNYNDDADIKFGFLLTYNDPVAHSREIEAHVVSVDNNKVEFEATFNYLEPNRNYTYCAFTNDGLYYNYGKPFSFKIENTPNEGDNPTPNY